MKPSERNLRHELEELTDADEIDAEIPLSVEWRDAAPADRPDGMVWDPPSDDGEPATLSFDLWQAQRDALESAADDERDITALLGGYGSGKSVFGARWLVATALANPGSRFLCMGQSFSEARDTTFPKLYGQLPGDRTTLLTSAYNGPERSPIVRDYNRQERRLTLVNDSVIVLGSADKYSRFAGAEFGGVWLDEPSHYGSELHDITGMMTTRLRGVDGPKTQVWTLTGEGYNAAYEILEQRKGPDGEPIGLDIDVITASVLDNPYLPDGDKERFKRKYAGTAREEQALHGGFAAATGLVYSEFNREVHVVDPGDAVDRVEEGWRIYGYDAGWNDPRVVIELGRTPAGQLVALSEYYRTETHIDDAMAWLADRPDGRIYAEHVPSEIDRLRKNGYRVEKARKDIDSGISEVRRRLTSDGDRPGMLVSQDCENLIQEFLGYQEENVGSSTATDHALDATRYAVMGEAADGGGVATGMVRFGDRDADPDDSGDARSDGVSIDDAAKAVGSKIQKFNNSGKW